MSIGKKIKKSNKKIKKGVTKGANEIKKGLNIIEELGKALLIMVKTIFKMIPPLANVGVSLMDVINNNNHIIGVIILLSPVILIYGATFTVFYLFKNKDKMVQMKEIIIANEM